MKKTICLIRGTNTESYADFKERMLALVNLLATNDTVLKTKVVLTVNPPPKISIIPFKKGKIASLTIKSLGIVSLEDILKEEGFVGSFDLTEALPVAYNKTWAEGTITPGVCLLTVFNQKKSIDYKTFIHRWHNSHTPLSLKIHPLTHYDRNVVVERGTNNTENWDGIVEEHCNTRADLLNPIKFFGGAFNMIPNMIKVYTDTKSFLDYGTIETYLTAEYHIKS